MENLESYGVVQMNQTELERVEGGLLAFWIGVGIGLAIGLIVWGGKD